MDIGDGAMFAFRFAMMVIEPNTTRATTKTPKASARKLSGPERRKCEGKTRDALHLDLANGEDGQKMGTEGAHDVDQSERQQPPLSAFAPLETAD